MIDITKKWPKELREKRGLLNGKRVQMAYELRGIARYQLARKLHIPTKELEKREKDWDFWTEEEKQTLLRATNFPIGFFTREDPYEFEGPIFYSGHDENGEHWCRVQEGDAHA